MTKLVLITLWLTLSAGVALASPSVHATGFVAAKAPARATAEQFKSGSFAVTVTCRSACKATVFATIRASAAKRLGFTNVRGKFVLVGTGNKALKAHTPATIRVVPTSAAKKHLANFVGVFGSVKGVPASAGTSNNYFTGWYARLG